MPTDCVRWACVGLGMLVLWRGAEQLDHEHPPRWLMWLAPLAAAVLSMGYVAYYLRGGPRIIDATAYYAEARAMAAGMWSVPLPQPEQAMMGRFFVRASTTVPSAAVIFPPGYPAVLALGFTVGHPLLVGPVIAALLVTATMKLAGEVARCTAHPRPGTVVTYAALASVFCAALRYHTADTMSHGLAALCTTCALLAWLRVTTRRSTSVVAWFAFGASAGLLFATRPASALALCAAITLSVATDGVALRGRAVLASVAGAAAPVALWFGYQSHVTGSLLHTAQSLYYAASDGPPDCFRYGFGAGIGCRGEHGTFVDANLLDGYGLIAAAKTTGRRLMMHVSDAMGFAPAFAAVIVGGAHLVRQRRARVLVWVVIAQWLAYAPFYFDGNYPGGGARLFAEVLPSEHVLAAAALGSWQLKRWSCTPSRAAAILLGVAFLGFAIHAGAHHEQLRDREGGRPMFRALGSTRRDLLFIDTDHGFNLAFDPAHPDRVVRHHGDAFDTIAWNNAGRPPAHLYRYDFDTGQAHITTIAPGELSLRRHLEGESMWPAISQRNVWAVPRHVSEPCASAGRVLAVKPMHADNELRLALPDAVSGTDIVFTVIPQAEDIIIKSNIYSYDQVLVGYSGRPAETGTCRLIGPVRIPRGARGLQLGLSATGAFGLDVAKVLKNR